MASISRSTVAAATGAAALLGATSFVATGTPASTGHLRASTTSGSSVRVEAAHSRQTQSLAVAGVAVAALTAGGRKALCNIKPKLVRSPEGEDWSAEVKPPRNLDAGGGVSLTAKNLIPEIIRRAGWTSHACAILTVQPPSELGLLGFPRQRVQCRISVMTETGERKEIMIQRWLIQLGYGQPVVHKMQGELVSMFATVKSCIAKFSPRFGWPVGQIGASIAANEIFK
eukprot:symbB.v1.2.036299.t1/scaffold5093.1/size31020/1